MEGEGARSPPGAVGGAEEGAGTPGNMINDLPEFDVAGCDDLKINLSIPRDYDQFQHNEALMGRKTDYDFEIYTIKLRNRQNQQEKQAETKVAEEQPKLYDASKHMHRHDASAGKKNAEPKGRKEGSQPGKARSLEEKDKAYFKNEPLPKTQNAGTERPSAAASVPAPPPAQSQAVGIGNISVTCKPAFSLKEQRGNEEVHKLVPKMVVNLDAAEQPKQAPRPKSPPAPEHKQPVAKAVVAAAKPESSGKFKLMLNCIEIDGFPAYQQSASDEVKIEIAKAESKPSKGLKLSASPGRQPYK